MTQVLPLTLVGSKLGERHKYLNTLINHAHQQNVPIQSILELPELSSIDRVFKIEVASKCRHVDFILMNLKEKDMLYVSKALKCAWLMEPEYKHIINPVYLETHLYPLMITPAVNKMKNFIELRLREPDRCQEFYEYYRSNFDIAVKYLWHCSKEFITEEVLKVLDRLTPKHLRILCEACPKVAKLYFEALQTNKVALQNYVNKPRKYWSSIFNVLKVEGELFLGLVEKYFDRTTLKSLNSSATKYIMKNYKKRYLAKPELYAGWLLNIKTLAKYLTHEEIHDIVLKLARAEYISYSYTYKDAEPFLKRLGREERVLLKKRIFVDKSIGDKIETWPYPPPEGPQLSESENELLGDIEHRPYEYENLDNDGCFRRLKLSKRRCAADYASAECMMSDCMPFKSSLDQLYDRYRFVNFDRTFFEFRKMLLVESTIEGRRNLILVLVSKAGGNEAKLKQLLNFLVERHSNEPVNLREAIVRSMVKRAFVWRLTVETWELLLKWATTSVSEILHAKVLRHLLADSTCPTADLTAYLVNFSDLTSYTLNAAEKACVAKRLPALLISANAPEKLLDILTAYKLRVTSVPGAEDFLVSAARNNEDLLQRLFKSRIARKQILKESFKIAQNDASYVNALRHDPSVLESGESFVNLMLKEKPNHDRYLRSLVLYFSEPEGLAAQHFVVLQKAIDKECRESLARPFAFLYNLGGESFKDYLSKNDVKSLKDSQRKFAVAVRANAFVVRPPLDIDNLNWQDTGPKFVCNKVLLCSDSDVNANIQKCLNWRKTMRVALHLGVRSRSADDVFVAVVRARPTLAVKRVISDIRKGTVDLQTWNQVKPIISDLDLSKNTLRNVKRSLRNYKLKSNVEADYWSTVYGAFRRVSELKAMPILCKMENLLTEVDQNSLQQIILEFLRDKLNKDEVVKYEPIILALYFRVIGKYLLTSKSDEEQKLKIETVCDPFFDKIENLWREMEDKSKLDESLDDFLFSLKYTKAFMNTKFVSCIPMFSRILERLSKIFPREHHFAKYVSIHVAMLYCRAIGQALKQRPELFENSKLINDEGVELVGFILGKYIGMEIKDLVGSYFRSIIEIYQHSLVKFFSNYFEYGRSRDMLVKAVIRGLIEVGNDSQLLAQYVLEKENYNINEEEKKEILKLLKNANNEEMKFFLYADINAY